MPCSGDKRCKGGCGKRLRCPVPNVGDQLGIAPAGSDGATEPSRPRALRRQDPRSCGDRRMRGLREGAPRRPPLKRGSFPPSSRCSSPSAPPAATFSADSSRATIANASSGFSVNLFSCSSDGTGFRELLFDERSVSPVGWLGCSNRFLVTACDESEEAEVLAIVEESGTLSGPIQASSHFDTSFDSISISADGSAVAVLEVTFGSGLPPWPLNRRR